MTFVAHSAASWRTWVLVPVSAALLMAVLIYACARPANSALLLPWSLPLPSPMPAPLAALAGWFPSFAHTFAFTLFTVPLAGPGVARAVAAAISWVAINAAFEIAQSPSLNRLVASWFEAVAGSGLGADATTRYLLRGTFDPGDLVAVVLGAAVAVAYAVYVECRCQSQRSGEHR